MISPNINFSLFTKIFVLLIINSLKYLTKKRLVDLILISGGAIIRIQPDKLSLEKQKNVIDNLSYLRGCTTKKNMILDQLINKKNINLNM